MKKNLGLILCLILFSFIQAQDKKTFSNCNMNGYLSGMPSMYWYGDSSAWQVLLHNHLNFDWYPSDRLTGSLQFRNQLIGGDIIEAADLESGFKQENYFLPLTFHQTLGNKYILSLSIDRAWMQYTYNSLEVKVGRQRINWGQTFVWNPNDLFNSYNFFDFDYPERPGADAVRIQYYTSYTSSIDLAMKVDSAGKITAGGLFHFNKWNTDFQVMAGYFSQENRMEFSDTLPSFDWETEDLVGGLGFSGAVGNVSLRGELSYFYSLLAGNDSTNQFLGSVALDYSFTNQLYLMFEFFYNSNVQLPGTSFLNFYAGSQNVKTLTYTKYNLFGQMSYPITPIVNTTVAAMYFWDDYLVGAFVGPSVDVSLGDNLMLAAFFQFFTFGLENPISQTTEWGSTSFAFLRLKWNF